MGSLELQIFVSLFVILGAAFVALLCDFLKGNNERLRERNIELQVRHEERDKREVLLERAQRQAWNAAVQAQEAVLSQAAAVAELETFNEAPPAAKPEEPVEEPAPPPSAASPVYRIAPLAGPVEDPSTRPVATVGGQAPPVQPPAAKPPLPGAEAPPLQLPMCGPRYPDPMPSAAARPPEETLVFCPQAGTLPGLWLERGPAGLPGALTVPMSGTLAGSDKPGGITSLPAAELKPLTQSTPPAGPEFAAWQSLWTPEVDLLRVKDFPVGTVVPLPADPARTSSPTFAQIQANPLRHSWLPEPVLPQVSASLSVRGLDTAGLAPVTTRARVWESGTTSPTALQAQVPAAASGFHAALEPVPDSKFKRRPDPVLGGLVPLGLLPICVPQTGQAGGIQTRIGELRLPRLDTAPGTVTGLTQSGLITIHASGAQHPQPLRILGTASLRPAFSLPETVLSGSGLTPTPPVVTVPAQVSLDLGSHRANVSVGVFRPFAEPETAVPPSEYLLPVAGLPLESASQTPGAVVRIRVIRDEDMTPLAHLPPAPPAEVSFPERQFLIHDLQAGLRQSGSMPTEAADLPEADEPFIVHGGFTEQAIPAAAKPSPSSSLTLQPQFGAGLQPPAPQVPTMAKSLEGKPNVLQMPAGSGENGPFVPAGVCPSDALASLLEVPGAFAGSAMVIAAPDFEDVVKQHGAAAVEQFMQEILASLQGAAGQDAFLCRPSDGEFVLVWPKDRVPSPSSPMRMVTERIWDFQLRTLGNVPLIFNWGLADSKGDTLAGLLRDARESMLESRRNRRTTFTGAGRFRRQAG